VPARLTPPAKSLTPSLQPGHCDGRVLPPLKLNGRPQPQSASRGSITRLPPSLSTLRSRPLERPRKTRFRLGGQPLPGRTPTCWASSQRGFRSAQLTPASLPPPPGLPWRTAPGTYSTSPSRPEKVPSGEGASRLFRRAWGCV
jgi:hypothetical protein